MLDLGFVAILTVLCAGLGHRVVGWSGASLDSAADRLGLALAVGLGLLGVATFALGEVGMLSPAGVGVLLIVVAGVGARGVFALGRALGQSLASLAVRPSLVSAVAGLLLFLTLLGTLLTALAPVTDGDALCYHLQVPKVFLDRGGLFFDPDLHETVYPLLTEMLYAVALAVRGPVACRLIQWVWGVVFMLNVTALARPSLGGRAWWAGLVALAVPAISNGMSAPLNDVALAALGCAALLAWSLVEDRPSPRGAILTGLVVGLAVGVKYPALVLTGLISVMIAWRSVASIRERHDMAGGDVIPQRPLGAQTASILRLLVPFALTALVVGGGWYLRAWIYTGNPVYPFFRHVFGGAGLDEVLDPIKRPMTVSVWGLLTALGPLTLQPARFDSVSHQFGPAFLLFLPALLLYRAPRTVTRLVLIGYAFLLACLTQRQSMRFLLIATGPFAVGVAWLASTWYDRWSRPGRVVLVVLAAVLGFESAIAVARSRHGLNVLAGRESADKYLARREPTYQVGQWMAEHLPQDARIIGQDHRGFYLPRRYTMELAHRRRTGLGRGQTDASRVVATLADEGFTHVLFCPPVPENAVEFDPTLSRLLEPWLKGQSPLFTQSLSDADGVQRSYAIYPLPSVAIARAQKGVVR